MMPCFPKALIFRWKDRASWAKTTMESKTEVLQADFIPSSGNPAALAAQTSFTSIQTWHIGSGWYLKPVWQRESPPKFWKLVQVCQIVWLHMPQTFRCKTVGSVDSRWRAERTRHRWHCSWNPLQPPRAVASAGCGRLPLDVLRQQKKCVMYELVWH